ncbi:unnamed protein product [Ilex paraguariensis]|uniref:Uncharacterized protein n=1 Tax=Ilex paraguariensis TaxID=185542 RepID=A0ABC8V4H6_9AQUA
MACTDSFSKPHRLVQDLASPVVPKPSKSYTNFLCKSLIIVLVLVVIPLFPSQAPEFIRQSIITKFWELLHLLFIGIAVSYGLFSRKKVKLDVETHSRNDSSQNYLSGILQVSSIFEDGFENFCGSDEKKGVQTWNSRYLQSASIGAFTKEEGKDYRSSVCKNGFENPYGSDEKKVTQYFHDESMVVIANGNYGLDQWGKPLSDSDYKPLGLPIRSLRSRNADTDTSESINRSGSSSSLRDSSKRGDKIDQVKFRGMAPINLGEKFREVAVPSPIPWRSKSGRMEMREEVISVKPPSHTRPLSVGQFDLENLKSRSFPCPKPSESSSMSASLKKPSHSISPELPNSRKKNFEESSMRASNSPLSPRNGEASFLSSKKREFSIGSSSEMNVRRSSIDDLKRDLSNCKREDPLGREKQDMDSLASEVKSSTLVKGLSRGKSVRTIRSSKQFVETKEKAEGYSNQRDDKFGMKWDQIEVTSMENPGRRERPENLPVHYRKHKIDHLCHIPNSTFYLYQNGEKQDTADSVVEAKEDSESESELDNFHVSSESSDEEEAQYDSEDDAELETSEVDRKAGEFIAKFREQIKLQKTASMERYPDW